MSIKKVKGTDGWLVSLSLRHNGKRLPRVERICKGYIRDDGTIVKAKDHAIELQAKLTAEIREKAGKAKVVNVQSRTIEDWIALFFEKRYQREGSNSRSTMISRINHFSKFCKAEDLLYLHQVTPRLAEMFWQRLDASCAGRGGHVKFEAASALINFAIQQGGSNVGANPLKGVTRVQPEKDIEGRWLEDEEVEALLSVAAEGDESAYLSYVILLETGMRRDELRNLPRHRIDFRNHTAKIDRYRHWKPKTDSSRRYVPLSQRCEQAVKRLLEIKPDGDYLLPSPQPSRSLTEPRSENWLQNHFEALRGQVIAKVPWMRAALEEMKNGKHVVSLHCFRHTCLSRLLQEGVDIHTVGQIAGQSDQSITETYAKFSKPNLHAAISRLSNRSLNNYGTANGTATIIKLPKTGS